MKYKIILISIVACFMYIKNTQADKVITLSMRPYPLSPDYCTQVVEKLKKPGKIATHCVYGTLDTKIVAGIFSSFAGKIR